MGLLRHFDKALKTVCQHIIKNTWLEEEVPDEGSDVKSTKCTLTQNGKTNTTPTNEHAEPNVHSDIKRYRYINNNTNININRHGGRVFVCVRQNN